LASLEGGELSVGPGPPLGASHPSPTRFCDHGREGPGHSLRRLLTGLSTYGWPPRKAVITTHRAPCPGPRSRRCQAPPRPEMPSVLGFPRQTEPFPVQDLVRTDRRDPNMLMEFSNHRRARAEGRSHGLRCTGGFGGGSDTAQSLGLRPGGAPLPLCRAGDVPVPPCSLPDPNHGAGKRAHERPGEPGHRGSQPR
jgi:hypothetical protein